MRPALVTVLPGGSWEPGLVLWARTSGSARVLGRCGTPGEVERWLDHVDVVFVGDDTSWVGTGAVRRWKDLGITVVGVAGTRTDALLRAIGCDVVMAEHEHPHALITAATGPSQVRPKVQPADLITVTGPRGAPGRSEISLALASLLSDAGPTLLAELDTNAPSLGLRIGLSPRPDITDVDPAVGAPPVFGHLGALRVATAPPRPGPLAPSVVQRVLAAARAEPATVVADIGPPPAELAGHTMAVVVCDPSDRGLTRVARLMDDWPGSPPLLVVNRPSSGQITGRDVEQVRRATGLDPAAAVNHHPELTWGRPPPDGLLEQVRPLAEAVVGQRALR